LVVERGDDEGVILKPATFTTRSTLALPVSGNVELATADRFYSGRVDQIKGVDPGILVRAHRRCCLLKLVGASVKMVTRKTPCAPSNAALSVSGLSNLLEDSSAIPDAVCLEKGESSAAPEFKVRAPDSQSKIKVIGNSQRKSSADLDNRRHSGCI